MDLSRETHDDVLVLTVQAERIDAASAIQMKDCFREAIKDWDQRVLVDLKNVNFMDSSGLGAMVAALKCLNGRPLELTGMTPAVEKVFSLTRMDKVFTLHDSRKDALGAGESSKNDATAA
ncbi:STAS domain-containing protein [Litoreibacter roseus]|uniref:Anti-sigma factor antagonist n=1 Tax=Litoreibacter roseus TaxID=2601869 RepID=A0A6N6JIX2_9RHOB|nr:STAS domain-containing protein [Litoreibacter roseus]GFE66281.1 anti-sigma factor antagonist [Litoreibacter roseus]